MSFGGFDGRGSVWRSETLAQDVPAGKYRVDVWYKATMLYGGQHVGIKLDFGGNNMCLTNVDRARLGECKLDNWRGPTWSQSKSFTVTLQKGEDIRWKCGLDPEDKYPNCDINIKITRIGSA
jgi:hypothetical protein